MDAWSSHSLRAKGPWFFTQDLASIICVRYVEPQTFFREGLLDSVKEWVQRRKGGSTAGA
jgi:hypothetical protein